MFIVSRFLDLVYSRYFLSKQWKRIGKSYQEGFAKGVRGER